MEVLLWFEKLVDLYGMLLLSELARLCADWKSSAVISQQKDLEGVKQRKRCSFNQLQVSTLEKEFLQHRYLTTDQRAKLASVLNLTEQQV